MKFSLEIVAFAVVACRVINGTDVEDIAWTYYKLTYGKDYGSDLDDGRLDVLHKEVFLANLAKIQQHNSASTTSYKQEINRFTDLFSTELKQYLGLSVSLASTGRQLSESTKEIGLESRQVPSSLDYRLDSCMSPIKDQGQCGSCWAFAAIAPLEFSHCKSNQNTLVLLSEQQLLDCDKGNNGCDGGWYTSAWEFIQKVGGSTLQLLYSYSAQQSILCKFWLFKFGAGARISSFSNLASNNPVGMQVAVQNYGPIAVAFAVTSTFYSYASGVYDDSECDGETVNHAVVIVGWGSLNGLDYWIVRNSWGTGWGLQGYFLIQRGVNKCSIEFYPAYVVAGTKVTLWQLLSM